MNQAEGATPLTPQELAEKAQNDQRCMNRWKHSMQWVWVNGIWTDKTRCTTCGEIFEHQRFGGQ